MTTISLRAVTRFYAQLLAYQYRDLPRASQFTELLAKQALGDLFGLEVQDAFNISDAIGAQLDVIGRYVGASRIVALPINRPFFGLWDSTVTDPVLQNTNGLASSTDAGVNPQAIFYQSGFIGQQNVALSDAAYRLVIQLQIVNNTTDSTLAQIQNYLAAFLLGVVEFVDNEDMTMTYTVSRQTPVPITVLELYLPRPAGVGIDVVVFDASASPASLSQLFHFNAPHTVVSSAITITPVNGTGPYTYSWQRLSETRPDFPDSPGTSAVTPLAASTTFTHPFGGSGHPFTSVSTWQCVVTDSAGLSVTVGPISVTLTLDGPP